MINLKTKTILLTFIFLFLVALPAFGEGGLVTCGNEGQPACTFNDFFALINTVFNFVLYQLVPAIAVIGIVWAAITMMTSAGEPGKFDTGKRAITYIAVGLVVIYLSWFLVKSFIAFMGGASWTTNLFQK